MKLWVKRYPEPETEQSSPHAEEAAKPPSRSARAAMPIEGASVYIVLCADGSYYTGLTRKDVETRVSEHNLGLADGYTARRRPVHLAWSQQFDRLTDAIAMERQVKGWSRAKKEALMRGDFVALPALAARRTKLAVDTGGGPSSFETPPAAAPKDEEP